MFSTIKLCLLHTNRGFLFKNLQRQISKTTTTRNRDAIIRKQNTQLYQNISNNNRTVSTVHTKSKPTTLTIASKDEIREFMAVFPDLVQDLTSEAQQTDMPEVNKRFAKLLNHTVAAGSKYCGLSVLTSYKLLEKPENLTPENIRRAIVLGWCVEIVMSVFFITDDFVDKSKNRLGLPCWYKFEDVGTVVVNDGLLLMESLFAILKKYFSNHHCYVPVMEAFHEASLNTARGEVLDLLHLKDGRPNLEFFTTERYSPFATYKTSSITYILPITLAMYLANVYDAELHRQVRRISMGMGLFFQIQDDYLDCFVDPAKTGKCSRDINDGKCTWLSVLALQNANPQQRKIMEQYYGKDDPEAVRIIKNLYEELDLPNIYAAYEEKSFNTISTHIERISKELPHEIFTRLLEVLYKRECCLN